MTQLASRERDVYSLRLAGGERRVLECAAASRNEHLSEYIRRTALAAAVRDGAFSSRNDG